MAAFIIQQKAKFINLSSWEISFSWSKCGLAILSSWIRQKMCRVDQLIFHNLYLSICFFSYDLKAFPQVSTDHHMTSNFENVFSCSLMPLHSFLVFLAALLLVFLAVLYFSQLHGFEAELTVSGTLYQASHQFYSCIA